MVMTPVGSGLRRLATATVVVTFLLIVAGGVVRVTGSGLGCGAPVPGHAGENWPLCNGRLVPPPDLATLIEFSHRLLAFAATVLMAGTMLVTWARYRSVRRIVVAATTGAVLLLIQILLGLLVVETGLLGSTIAIHLANAELLLGVLVYLAYAVWTAGTGRDRRPAAPERLRRLLWVAAGAVYLLILSGALVVDTSSSAGCLAWPLCGNGLQLSAGQAAAVNLVHRGLVLVIALLVGYAMGQVLRRTADRGLRMAAMLTNLLLLAQIVAGAVMVDTRMATAARSSHEALASAFWAMTLLVAILGHRASFRVSAERAPAEARRPAAPEAGTL